MDRPGRVRSPRRQGFGRLIRHRTDRGVVLILDSRVVRRGYGRLFLNSLPDVPVSTLPRAELVQAIQRFFSDVEPDSSG